MLSYTVFRLQEHGPSKSFHAGHRGLLAQMVVTFNCDEELDRGSLASGWSGPGFSSKIEGNVCCFVFRG